VSVVKTIFAEKYRPQTLEDVAGQEDAVKNIQGFIEHDKIPHMLFTGPAGVGKTTAAIALAKDLFGKEWKKYFLEMNASDDNGIKTIREKVKNYARIKVVERDYKLIFMDEADNMTREAQSALRRIIEKYSDTCRFILSCNYPNKIIDPIKDRCVVFRFKKINPEHMTKLIKKVVTEEKMDMTEDAQKELAKLSHGTMRVILNTLYRLKYGDKSIQTITKKEVRANMCYVDDKDIQKLVYLAKKGDIKTVEEELENVLYNKGYTTIEIIRALRRLLKTSKVLSNADKIKALVRIGDLDFRIAEGATPDIQLKTYFVYLMQLYKE
jgi:replication factor C small subunit